MDPDQESSRTRKHKFAPKPPPKRKPKLRSEADDKQKEDSSHARSLLRESLARREPKVERKPSVEVAFGPGVSFSSLRTYGTSKASDSGTSNGSPSKLFANEQTRLRLPSAATEEDKNDIYMMDVTDDATNESAMKNKGEYMEPWNYGRRYPTTLPLRRPMSGDPEILDEKEFGEAAASVEYDENAVNHASELGLLEKSEQKGMFFFQFPATLPLNKQTNKGKEQIGTSTVTGEPTKPKGIALEELPTGYMGKMVVYKSGAIKLKLGETLFDVSSGTNCVFRQDIVAMNAAQKQCSNLGEISKRVVLVPDLDSIDL